MKKNHQYRLRFLTSLFTYLLIFIVVVLSSCFEKQVVSEGNLFQKEFASSSFFKVLPPNYTVQWSTPSTRYSDVLGFSYSEFPIIYPQNNLRGNYLITYKLLARKDQNSITFYVAKFYEEKNSSPQESLSLENTRQFSGIVHVVDKDLNVIFASKLKDGEVIDSKIH